jgi:hypothetical protein
VLFHFLLAAALATIDGYQFALSNIERFFLPDDPFVVAVLTKTLGLLYRALEGEDIGHGI